MANYCRIANVQGFWGDSPGTASRMLDLQPDVHFLTLDYLAEVSLSIMAIQREKNPELGYAQDFIDVIRSLVPYWQQGSRVRIVTNAGGLNPRACAEVCQQILDEAGCKQKVAIVEGDDVLNELKQNPSNGLFKNLETNQSLETILEDLTTANAYVGGSQIAQALNEGAHIVITGRVADPSMVAGAAVHYHRWSWSDYNKIAGATVAGHLIECGTQVTGGISTHWLELPDMGEVGFPYVDIGSQGECYVSKPEGTGGRVDLQTVKEQLVYEIGDPGNYLSPDVTVSFSNLLVQQQGENRVRIWGANGAPPPAKLKVSATFKAGFRSEGMLLIVGSDAEQKARRAGEVVQQKLKMQNQLPEQFLVEVLGAGDSVGGTIPRARSLYEVVLRMACSDRDRDKVAAFTREIAPLVTSGPPGTTGYASGRPKVRPIFGYWPCLARPDQARTRYEILRSQ